MPAARHRRWIGAVFFVIVFPLAAVHFSCVAVLGPGSWGSGVEQKEPTVHPAEQRVDLAAYADEWETNRHAAPASPPGWAVERLEDQEEELVWADRLKETGHAALLTSGGKNWTEKQKLYVSESSAAPFQQVEIPSGMILQRPAFLWKGAEAMLAVGRWNSWAVSPTEKLSRYGKSWFNPALRPENSIYIYGWEAGVFEILGPGGGLQPSPDRSQALIVRSGALGTTLHSLHVWNPGAGHVETIASFSEVDRGSGRSFDYGWSSDSKAVFIGGAAGGFRPRDRERRELRWIYLTAEKKTYSIEQGPARLSEPPPR